MQRMAHDSGECATAAAAANSGTLMTLSSWSTTALEEVATAGGPAGARWFQLYVYKVPQVHDTSVGYTHLTYTVMQWNRCRRRRKKWSCEPLLVS